MHHALTFPLRATQRLALAIKFYTRLHYSWHLAWTKAARPHDIKGWCQ